MRNPFDRLVAAYNNKIMEIDDVPSPMKRMGLYHAMPFKEFIELVCKADPAEMDNHIRPQTEFIVEGCDVFRLEDGMGEVYKSLKYIFSKYRRQ